MRTVAFLNIIRGWVLLSSALALISHISQCILFDAYRRQTGIPEWLKAGHWQYLLWYITLTLSLASATAICIHASCRCRSHIVRGDRNLAVFNMTTLALTILLITFFDGQEPWTDGLVEFMDSAKGFIPYCSFLKSKQDPLYLLLFHRCVLVNATYILASLTFISWAILLFSVWVTRSATSCPSSIVQHPVPTKPERIRCVPEPTNAIVAHPPRPSYLTTYPKTNNRHTTTSPYHTTELMIPVRNNTCHHCPPNRSEIGDVYHYEDYIVSEPIAPMTTTTNSSNKYWYDDGYLETPLSATYGHYQHQRYR